MQTNVDPKKIGRTRPGEMTERSYVDEWYDAPTFNPGQTEDSEHQYAFPAGMQLTGCYKGLGTLKNPGPKKVAHYGKFIDQDGNYFKISAPGQLKHELEKTPLAAIIGIEYLGKEYVKAKDNQCHQFKIYDYKN